MNVTILVSRVWKAGQGAWGKAGKSGPLSGVWTLAEGTRGHRYSCPAGDRREGARPALTWKSLPRVLKTQLGPEVTCLSPRSGLRPVRLASSGGYRPRRLRGHRQVVKSSHPEHRPNTDG